MENLHLCSDLATVHLKTPRGYTRRITANIEEISASAALLQLERPLAKGTRLRLECSRCVRGCDRRGQVEDCRLREGIGYDCKVVFDEGCAWDPDQCRPAHLLDLKRLADDAAQTSGCDCPNRRVCPREVIARLIAPDVPLSTRARAVAREVASLCGELDDSAVGVCFTGLFHAEPTCRLFAEFHNTYRAKRIKLRAAGRTDANTARKVRRLSRLLESIPTEALGPMSCSTSAGK